MASSGTYVWFPDGGDLLSEAFERAGMDPSSISSRHALSARTSLNYMFSDWQNDGIFEWKLVQKTHTVTTAEASFSLGTGEIDIIEAVLRRDSTDVTMIPISRQEFSLIPNKTTGGRPDRYWVDRQLAPTVYYWPIAENSTDQIIY